MSRARIVVSSVLVLTAIELTPAAVGQVNDLAGHGTVELAPDTDDLENDAELAPDGWIAASAPAVFTGRVLEPTAHPWPARSS